MILYRNIGCLEMENLCFGRIIQGKHKDQGKKIPALRFFYKTMPMEKSRDDFWISVEISASDCRIIKQDKNDKIFLTEYSIADVRNISVCRRLGYC